MNLQTLLKDIKNAPAGASLIFTTDDGEVRGGYHITEFRLGAVSGIDCGARISQWSEAAIELLDGYGHPHMKVGKFAKVLERSIRMLDGLGTAPAHVEFAHGNRGLRRYALAAPDLQQNKVILRLSEMTAVCKPANEGVFRAVPANKPRSDAHESKCCA